VEETKKKKKKKKKKRKERVGNESCTVDEDDGYALSRFKKVERERRRCR
jgi:hypothetical protein